MSPLVYAVTKHFKPNLNATHLRDFNFFMRLEIFIHYDGQLRTSHLILDGIPSYTSYHDLEQAFTISTPLLSYIDVRLRGFLPRGLTLFKARRLDP